jgi:hypothetical protein
MTTDPRPIVYCPTCECDVVTRPDGRCQWCLTFLVSHAQPRQRTYQPRFRTVDRRVRRRADGLCAVCEAKPARPTRSRCLACETQGIPPKPVDQSRDRDLYARVRTLADEAAA